MEKITDKEIIKALECCHMVNGCERCPLRNDTDECEILNTYALDLLLRQKAEIERLRKENKILSVNADTAFQDGLNENRDLFKKEVEHEIKSEAIKEFASKLKSRIRKDIDEQGMFPLPYTKKAYDTVFVFADNLVKEMTEEGK